MKREYIHIETYEYGKTYENIERLKLKATDGKMHETDAVNTNY